MLKIFKLTVALLADVTFPVIKRAPDTNGSRPKFSCVANANETKILDNCNFD